MATSLTYPGVHLFEESSGTHTIGGATTSVAAFVGYLPEGPVHKPTRVFNFAEFGRTFGGLHEHCETSYAVQQFFLNGGGQAWIVRANTDAIPQNIPDNPETPDTNEEKLVSLDTMVDESVLETGYKTLDSLAPDTFNILCFPDAIHLNSVDSASLYTKAAGFCEDEDAFLIIDPPIIDMDVETFKTWVDTWRSGNAALYYPLLQIPDPKNNNQMRKVGPSGTLAGIYARTDGARGVWKAPAGTEAKLRGATPSKVISDAKNGVYNQAGINIIRNFAGYGPVVWGARTLAGNDAGSDDLKYVPVRRTTLFLKKSLEVGLKWAVFEPNGEPLWAAIRLNVESFLDRLYRQGAFKGATAGEAYRVYCDETTTSPDDINSGIVNIVVKFAPYKPAEFVVVTLSQMTAQA